MKLTTPSQPSPSRCSSTARVVFRDADADGPVTGGRSRTPCEPRCGTRKPFGCNRGPLGPKEGLRGGVRCEISRNAAEVPSCRVRGPPERNQPSPGTKLQVPESDAGVPVVQSQRSLASEREVPSGAPSPPLDRDRRPPRPARPPCRRPQVFLAGTGGRARGDRAPRPRGRGTLSGEGSVRKRGELKAKSRGPPVMNEGEVILSEGDPVVAEGNPDASPSFRGGVALRARRGAPGAARVALRSVGKGAVRTRSLRAGRELTGQSRRIVAWSTRDPRRTWAPRPRDSSTAARRRG